jgi:predicted permease
MTAPLAAMIVAVFIAAAPDVQHHLFKEQSFINTSVVRAIEQSSGVAVPLILVVLGANLGHIPEEDPISHDEVLERKLVWVSLLARMVFPALLCAPLLVAMAKYVPISIVDDPVFVVVQFLLIGAPTALQLTQICQINDSYPGVMAKILFQSYVVLYVLPFALIHADDLVFCLRHSYLSSLASRLSNGPRNRLFSVSCN